MPTPEKREVIQSTAIFILSALLSYWLDARAEATMIKYTDDINSGLAKAQSYHETGKRPGR